MPKGSLNKMTIIGNVGKEPKLRYSDNDKAIVTMSVATTESSRDATMGEYTDKTMWHSVTMFGKLGEVAAKYLRPGSKVYIEGRLSMKNWTDKDGVTHASTEIIADRMEMLSKGSSEPIRSSSDK